MSETKTSFDLIQSRIDSFIQKISSQEDIFFKENKLQLSDAIFCAEDSTRNKKFYDAIGQALQDIRSKLQDDQKIRVVDAGAGL